MSLMQSTWSPFQSPELRAVLSHLTPSEREQLIARAQQQGRDIALWFAIPCLIVGGVWLMWWQAALVLWALLMAGALCFGILRQRTTRKWLCETAWARSQGLDAARMRMMCFPWSR